MAATSTRSPPNSYTFQDADSPQPQRRVSKQSSKSSFLSLKRTKKKSTSSIESPVLTTSPTPGHSRVGDKSKSPSSFHALQDPSEAILSGINRQASRQGHHSRRSSRSQSSRQDQVSVHSAKGSERQRSKKAASPPQTESQPFPVMDQREPSISDDHYGRRSNRSRSQRHADSIYHDDFEELVFHNRPFNVSLVDSASSVLSHYDAPKTPVDDHLFRDTIYPLPVVVAAPVPGVETMDALVDGMNDVFNDDHFTGSGGLSGRKKISKSGHHPLYHPPLPKPPPGVILGKVGQTSTPRRSQDSDEDEDATTVPIRRWSEQREHRKKRRAGSTRSPPSSTSSPHTVYSPRPASALSSRSPRPSTSLSVTDYVVTTRPNSSQSTVSAATTPSPSTSTPTNHSFIKDETTPTHHAFSSRLNRSDSTTSGPSPRLTALGDSPYFSRPTSILSTSTYDSSYSAGSSRAVAPSISEIIRTHAPAAQRTRSRKSSYARSFGHETVHEQPEPSLKASKSDDNDLVSRSSVDTIAEEVQRTLEKIPAPSPAPRPLHLSRSFPRIPVSQIDTRNVSSSRSDGRRESSLFSYSTTSDQPPVPGFDLSTLTKPPTNSPSQAIAQYLRSARLTTLLPLTRFPHASKERPLTVSLSDLGSPTGYPVVVFLGLGCVRHIMGLYDEMAECLNIRLITIDR